jgi:hypothetical protein
MNVSCWFYPAVASISLSIGASQADPNLTFLISIKGSQK